MIRRPRLLTASFAEARRLQPTALALTLHRRQTSTARLTQPMSAPGLPMHGWVELYTPTQSAGLFRVVDDDGTVGDTTVYTLNHAIDTLSDNVWRAQTDYSGTVPAYLAALLAQQNPVMWQLGTCAETKAWKRSGINYDNLADLLRELMDALNDCYLTFDFSTSPWTLNLLKAPEGVRSEFRLSRNVETCRIRRSDGDMCTKLFVTVNTKTTTGGVTTNTVTLKTYENAAAQALYGVIEKTADIDAADVPDVDAWAADFLARRARPAVQITVEGTALKALTGLDWDEHHLAALARVCLPDVPEALEERVESVAYPELATEAADDRRPPRVTVELAARLPKFSDTIASLKKQVRAAAGGAARAGRSGAQATELSHWAQIVSQHGDVLDDTGLQTLYETGIILDAQTGATIYSLSQGFVSQHSAINVNSAAITAEAQDRTDADTLLSGRIDVNAQQIALKVSKGDTATQLAVELGNVTITNGNLIVDGYVTTPQLSAVSALIENLTTGLATAQAMVITAADIDSLIFDNHQVSWQNKTVVTSRGTITMPSITLTSSRSFLYLPSPGDDPDTVSGRIITSYTAGSVGAESTTTIHYMGY